MTVTVWREEEAITFTLFWGTEDTGWEILESLDEDGVAVIPTHKETEEAVSKAESGMDESGQ